MAYFECGTYIFKLSEFEGYWGEPEQTLHCMVLLHWNISDWDTHLYGDAGRLMETSIWLQFCKAALENSTCGTGLHNMYMVG